MSAIREKVRPSPRNEFPGLSDPAYRFLQQIAETLNVVYTSLFGFSTSTGDTTLTNGDATILIDASSNAVTITLPTDAIEGQRYTIKCINDTFTCTVDPDGNEIDGDSANMTLIEDEVIEIQADSLNNWWII